MNIVRANNLACPLDGAQLEHREKQLICTNGHTFDVARQGYVNLLPVQHKRSKNPGDTKEMVVARTQFLNSGLYEPIAKKLAEITKTQIKNLNTTDTRGTCLLDAGCGEGYYCNFVLDNIINSDDQGDVSFIGLDISKHAIIEAAKRNKQITWIVGTNRQPPVADESVDLILCVFGFQSFEGFRKILKQAGKIILVEPGPDHLKELRAIIYADVDESGPPDLSGSEKMGFSIIDQQHLQFKTVPVGNNQINNLLIMTPHLYRATREGREAAAKLQQLEITVDIVFRILEKK